MKNYVFNFGGGKSDGDGKMKDVLGGKGAGLAEMSRAGVPVPPGFTISTEVCNIYFQRREQGFLTRSTIRFSKEPFQAQKNRSARSSAIPRIPC